MTIPAGIYLTGTIWLRDNVELHLEHASILKASGDMNDYNPSDAYPQNWDCVHEEWLGKHLIIVHETTGSALTGTGTIDGSADLFLGDIMETIGYCWRDGIARSRDKDILRPGQLICFIECVDVTVRDVTLRNMPCWGLYLYGCENLTVRGLRVFNPPYYANSDGIDIDTCHNVTVSDCIIDTADDAIAIRASCKRLTRRKFTVCEYVTISNCVLSSSSSVFRIGVGTGKIRHIRASNLVFGRGETGMNFQTDFAGVGSVDMEDVNFSNISAEGLAYPVAVWESNGSYIRNITIENYRAECIAELRMIAAHKDTVSDITIRNCDFKVKKESVNDKSLCECKNINRLELDNVKIKDSDGGSETERYHFTACTGSFNGKQI